MKEVQMAEAEYFPSKERERSQAHAWLERARTALRSQRRHNSLNAFAYRSLRAASGGISIGARFIGECSRMALTSSG